MAKDKTPKEAPEIPRAETNAEFQKDPRVIEIFNKDRINKEDAHYLMARIPTEGKERVKKLTEYFIELAAFEKEVEALKPFLEKEAQKPEYNGKSVETIRAEAEEAATNQYYNSKAKPAAPLPPEVLAAQQKEAAAVELWEQLLNAARTAAATPQQQSKRPKHQVMPIDKFSTVMFADWLDKSKEVHGQISMIPVKMEPANYKGELTLWFDISYPEELPDTERKLTPFDKRIYGSIYNLQQTNGSDMTYTQVYRNAGLGDKPSAKQLERAKKTIDKIRKSTTTWSNREEATAFNRNGNYIEYDGYLAPLEIITERKCFNGKPVEVYIRTLKPLPVMEFAKERNQIVTVPLKALQIPDKMNATDQNIAMIDFIVKRIEQCKREDKENKTPKTREKGTVKIVYDTLYKNTGANTRQKQRSMKTNLYTYLDEIKEQPTAQKKEAAPGYIKSYKEDQDKSKEPGVIIRYNG